MSLKDAPENLDWASWCRKPAELVDSRPMLTAKAYRALGWRLPASIPDDALVVPVGDER